MQIRAVLGIGILVSSCIQASCSSKATATAQGRTPARLSACSWPPQLAGDQAVVTLKVYVDGEGVVQRVRILDESPADQGVGDHAAACLFAKSFQPPRNADGQVTGGWTKPFSVRFVR